MLYNRAISEGLVKQENYPFGKGKVQVKYPDTLKMGLTEDEIIKIENVELEEQSVIWHARNVFLFSFYLAGMRISDVLMMKWNDINDGRLYYQMEKNTKVDSLKLPDKAINILEYYKEYRQSDEDVVFLELKDIKLKDLDKVDKLIANATRKFSSNLKKIATLTKISKTLSPHVARHSFGNIAGGKIPVQMLQKLYRHSDLSTTVKYQSNFDHSQTDEALNNVLNF